MNAPTEPDWTIRRTGADAWAIYRDGAVYDGPDAPVGLVGVLGQLRATPGVPVDLPDVGVATTRVRERPSP